MTSPEYGGPGLAMTARQGSLLLGGVLLRVLAELGLALLLKGLHAFTRLLGVVVQLERVHAHPRDAGLVRGVHVERTLGDRDRRRALLHDLVAPLLHFGVELLVRHDRVDQPYRERFGSRIAAAQIPD